MEPLSSLHLLAEAVRNAGADIAPTYQEYIQLAFAIATDCGEAGMGHRTKRFFQWSGKMGERF